MPERLSPRVDGADAREGAEGDQRRVGAGESGDHRPAAGQPDEDGEDDEREGETDRGADGRPDAGPSTEGFHVRSNGGDRLESGVAVGFGGRRRPSSGDGVAGTASDAFRTLFGDEPYTTP